MPLQQRVVTEFIGKFHCPPKFVVRAPGRVNLIGEHTDYNDGFVMPLAIDRALWIALQPRNDGKVVLHSLDYGQDFTFSLDRFEKDTSDWGEYVKGVAWALLERGYRPTGWEGTMTSNIPIGAGLSSSAAMEMAVAQSFASVSGISLEVEEMAKIGQEAENKWIGVSCGIMDQMISAGGEAGHALLIDCRSLETDTVPLPEGSLVVILDTTTRRGLMDSAYNERRSQCEAAAAAFQVPALRDVSLETFLKESNRLEETTRRRAHHVISENQRTLQAADAMKNNHVKELGKLMYASHLSLKDDFQVSNDALNEIVNCAQAISGCYGARMTGAGFGGCAVALVHTEAKENFTRDVAACFKRKTDLDADIYICQAANGVEVLQK
ncbi:MAG: galactokinase [Proteobacteria bacterium]|nr:galactokinase [Pseudomonadota bacterium]